MQKFSFKRMTAWLLTLVMVCTIIPVNVSAAVWDDFVSDVQEYILSKGDTTAAAAVGINTALAEAEAEEAAATEEAYSLSRTSDPSILDAAIFCSDVHGSTGDLTSVLEGVATSDVDYSSIGFVGDTCLTVANTTSTVQSALGDTDISVMFSYAASHDTENSADISTNWNYSGEVKDVSDYYLVYTICETDMQNNTDAEAAFTTWYSGLTDAQKKLPIFIMSHRPLHARRNDNDNAADWYEVISAAAETSDIVFFWAHNHTGETSADTDAYYVAKNGSEKIDVYKSSTVTPNFTYMNAGYINANGQNPERKRVATTVQITEDNLIFQDYTTTGTYTDSSYSHNVTVAREFASTNSGDSGTEETTKTLDSIVCSDREQVMYLIDDELEDFTVTAIYSDGTSAKVTGYTTDFDSSICGKQTVTVTYTEGEVTETTTFDVVVAYSIELTGVDVIDQTEGLYAITYTCYSSDAVSVAFESGDVEFGTDTDDNITVTEYVDGEDSRITVDYSEDGTTVIVTAKDDDYGTATASYTLGASDDSAVEESEAPSNEVTLGGTVTTTETKTVYVLTDTLNSGKKYLIVNSNTAGSGNALEYDNTSGETVTINAATTKTGAVYIETTNSALVWQYDSSSRFYNDGNGYLRLRSKSDGVEFTTGTSNASTVSKSGNYLYRSRSGSDYYLYYSNGWKTYESNNTPSSSTYAVYIYEETTVEVETTVDTTVTYTMRAEDMTKVVTEDNMTATLDYCLQGNGSDLTTLPSGGSYSFSVLSDENSIISSIDNGGTVTFTGAYGEATVKVAYTWTQDGETYTVYKNITVEATEPYYSIDLHKQNADNTVGDEITEVIAIKGVEKDDTYSVWAVVKYYDGTTEDGEDLGDVDNTMIEWTSSDESIATVDPSTGIITFTGKEGTVNITATYLGGNKPSDTITISATASQYSVPADGTSDFPEYPNEGAIRYDKTATAVGNFSETGIAQVEISMTGVPYTTGSEIDVVIMLDRSTSMTSTRVEATVAATKAFLASILINEDGTFNSNRVYVGYFMGSEAYDITDAENIGGALASVDNETEYNALLSDIDSEFTVQNSNRNTDWQIGLERCDTLLDAARADGIGNNRKQFCIFMSDGAPTDYRDLDNESNSLASGGSATSNWITDNARNSSYEYEYYSTEMKGEGVTVYSVLLGEDALQPRFLMNDLSGPGGEITQPDAVGTGTLSKQDTFYFAVADAVAAADMKNVFTNIAVSILQAATDITVEDKITPEYTMIFDIPTGSKTITGVTDDFYIEFVKYTLDDNHERTTETSVTKLYLKNTNDVYSAASDASGTAYAAPVFAQTTIGDKGTLYYWTTDATMAGKAAVSYNDGSNTYYFIPYGKEANEDGTAPTGWYNMTSGGYAYGTVDEDTNMSTDLVIATPYFVYNAATKMLYWTVDKLDTYEYALRYFLYLDNSATEDGASKELDAGTYPTNDHAYITYTNFNGNDCRQEFPVPQLTWNGAQVSYVFYLVNSAGQPINKSGQVVDFANATFITDVYTTSVVWSKDADGQIEGGANLSVDWLANALLPSDYLLYDTEAGYELKVYADASGNDIFNYFEIAGSEASVISNSLNERLSLGTTESNVSVETTKVYNTKAGTKYDDYGKYTSKATDEYDGETVLTGFDFSNSTVAFAVVWQPKLVPDTVVVDYGVDVLIDVVQNDLMQNTVTGIGLGKEAYGNTAMNIGVSTESKLGAAALTTKAGATISIENGTSIRYSQNDMEFAEADVFYYESPINFYENSEKKEGYMYSSVTVIPATTIYYEESFVDFWDSGAESASTTALTIASTTNGVWGVVTDTEYTNDQTTQDPDRPGASLISTDLDHDNVYGYDDINSTSTTYSLGSAVGVTVNSSHNTIDTAPYAEFTFTGTGFDIISLTDNTSGTIAMRVWDDEGNIEATEYIDNYYGYTYNEDGTWTVDESSTDCIWQVPILKISELDYDTYTVKVYVEYEQYFDHTGDDSYTFILDSIRIYDPADPDAEGYDDIKNVYIKDNEYNPTYVNIRDYILPAGDADSVKEGVQIDGSVFIDGINSTSKASDYTNPGPNNETYLAINQAVSFKITSDVEPASAQIGAKLAYIDANDLDGVPLMISIDGETLTTFQTLKTATDMYYEIPITFTYNGETNEWESPALMFANTAESGTVDASSVISLTNIKLTEKASTTTAYNLDTFSLVTLSTEPALTYLAAAEETENTVELITDAETLAAAFAVMRRLNAFEPEAFEYSLKTSSTWFGDYATFTVITSTDVADVKINGESATNLSASKSMAYILTMMGSVANKLGIDLTADDYYVWTYTAKASDKYSLITYDSEGTASEEIIVAEDGTTITMDDIQSVIDRSEVFGIMEELADRVFNPERFETAVRERADGVRQIITQTSEDVDYIIVDGEIVDHYITETFIDLSKDGEETVTRVFVTDADESTENVEVTAYDEEGVASSSDTAE